METAEERYQSAKGLKADLLICQQQLQNKKEGKIDRGGRGGGEGGGRERRRGEREERGEGG